MQVFETIGEIRAARWAEPSATWGLVPTMGSLHEGHLSLVRRAREQNDRVAVSIFVNPAQFNNPEDLDSYPNDLERDLDLLRAEGTDLVWTPRAQTVYPPGFQTYVDVEEITLPLEGGSRPGHFRGVATVVSKLFNVFEPRRAYFGQKDAQQALTVTRMVTDLDFNLEIVVCETVREANGLAMSSRNARLAPGARERAKVVYAALCAARDVHRQGERSAEALRAVMRHTLANVPELSVEYVSVADPATLQELDRADPGALLSLAVVVDEVRLIDNLPLT